MSESKIRWEESEFVFLGKHEFTDGYLPGKIYPEYSYTIQILDDGRFRLIDADFTIPVNSDRRPQFRTIADFDDLETAKAYAEKLEESRC